MQTAHPRDDRIVRILKEVQNDPVLLLIVSVVFVATIVLMVWIVSSSRKPESEAPLSVLSEAEREKVLAQVQDWIGVDGVKEERSKAQA